MIGKKQRLYLENYLRKTLTDTECKIPWDIAESIFFSGVECFDQDFSKTLEVLHFISNLSGSVEWDLFINSPYRISSFGKFDNSVIKYILENRSLKDEMLVLFFLGAQKSIGHDCPISRIYKNSLTNVQTTLVGSDAVIDCSKPDTMKSDKIQFMKSVIAKMISNEPSKTTWSTSIESI